MVQSFYSQVALGLLVLSCGFAIWKGGIAERASALLILATWLFTLLASSITRSYLPATAFLASDGMLAMGLLILAVRFSNLWLGAAMLLQAVALALHAGYFAAEKADLSYQILWDYVAGKNLASVLMLVIIVFATVASIRKRARARGATAERLSTAATAAG
jgi:hypothetical protein